MEAIGISVYFDRISPRVSGSSLPSANGNNGHNNGQPRLRDRLCLLIRQHRSIPAS
jgi:hypothetical protein